MDVERTPGSPLFLHIIPGSLSVRVLYFLFPVLFCFFSDRVTLFSSGWSWNWDVCAPTSHIMAFQVWAIELGSPGPVNCGVYQSRWEKHSFVINLTLKKLPWACLYHRTLTGSGWLRFKALPCKVAGVLRYSSKSKVLSRSSPPNNIDIPWERSSRAPSLTVSPYFSFLRCWWWTWVVLYPCTTSPAWRGSFSRLAQPKEFFSSADILWDAFVVWHGSTYLPLQISLTTRVESSSRTPSSRGCKSEFLED